MPPLPESSAHRRNRRRVACAAQTRIARLAPVGRVRSQQRDNPSSGAHERVPRAGHLASLGNVVVNADDWNNVKVRATMTVRPKGDLRSWHWLRGIDHFLIITVTHG